MLQVKTSQADTFRGQTAVCSTGRARLFAQGGVFKQDLTGKMFGTGQNCSFKWGVRLSRVFVRRGSTVADFFFKNTLFSEQSNCAKNRTCMFGTSGLNCGLLKSL